MAQSTVTPQGPDSPSSDFRLARVLAERKAQEGGYSALARAIDEASGADPRTDPGPGRERPSFDRRKVKSLIEGENSVVLALWELRYLDNYLERYGEGLAYAPLFQKPHLMQTLAASGRVTFFLGSKPDGGMRYFSQWDVLAMAEIQRGINTSKTGVSLDIQDVSLHTRRDQTVESLENSAWPGLSEDTGPSLVCLGSSRTSPATEAMLCKMFGLPYDKYAPKEKKRLLPFHFVWDRGMDYIFASHFHLSSAEIEDRDPRTAELVERRDASALVTAKHVYVDGVHRNREGDTYGLCVAQRRQNGQVWLVVAGVTGPATYVTAKLAKNIATRLHEQKRGQDSDVYWAVVRARVEGDPKRPLTSLRSFAEETIVSGLHAWKPQPESG